MNFKQNQENIKEKFQGNVKGYFVIFYYNSEIAKEIRGQNRVNNYISLEIQIERIPHTAYWWKRDENWRFRLKKNIIFLIKTF